MQGVPFAATSLVSIKGQNAPSLLFTYSQNPNTATLMFGALATSFGTQFQQIKLSQGGFMLPYAADAGNDQVDELVLYTSALNNNPLMRHILIFSTKDFSAAGYFADISSADHDFRGVALGYLGGTGDLRTVAGRKDLIALYADPKGNSSLLIRRANLNFMLP
jgi:hypothetical protein